VGDWPVNAIGRAADLMKSQPLAYNKDNQGGKGAAVRHSRHPADFLRVRRMLRD
jgi:argininosuccinate lyase